MFLSSPSPPLDKYLLSIYIHTPLLEASPNCPKALYLLSLNRFMYWVFPTGRTNLAKKVCRLFLYEVFSNAPHADPGIPSPLVGATDVTCYRQSLPEPFVEYPFGQSVAPGGVSKGETTQIKSPNAGSSAVHRSAVQGQEKQGPGEPRQKAMLGKTGQEHFGLE